MWKLECNSVDEDMSIAIGTIEEVGETVDFTPIFSLGTEYNPETQGYKAKVLVTRDHKGDLEYSDIALFDLEGKLNIPDDGDFYEAYIDWKVAGYEILIEGGVEFGANIVEPELCWEDGINKHAHLLFQQKVATGFVEENIEMIAFLSTKFVRGTEYTYVVEVDKTLTDNDDMSRSIELLTINDIDDEVTRKVILEGVRA